MHIFEFLPPVVSFAITLVGIFLMLHFFPKLKLMDRPHEYGLIRQPVPYSGGIIFFVSFLICTIIFVDVTKSIAGVIFGALLITFVSFVDDRIKLSPYFRLFIQILSALIIIFAGVKIQMISNPFGNLPIYLDGIEFNVLGQKIWLFSGLVIIAWIVLMMNVMNWIDGIPGLASGISTIAQISLFILSTRQFNIVDQSAIITVSSILAASTFAFLLFDFNKPKILMGDTGSMFLGFMLGSLSILAGGKLATALLIMGFPVLDAFWVILRRILQGNSPFKGDFSHLHHRLLNIGFGERGALLFNYFICALFAAIALLLNNAFSKFIAFILVFLLMGIVSILTKMLKHAKNR